MLIDEGYLQCYDMFPVEVLGYILLVKFILTERPIYGTLVSEFIYKSRKDYKTLKGYNYYHSNLK